MYSDRLMKMAKMLEYREAEIVVAWIMDSLIEVGLEHDEMCAITRPHSHSADCDCGRDELQEKILKVLDGRA